MASQLLPKGVTRQLLAAFLAVALMGILGVSLVAWQAERQALEEQMTSKLVTVANLKQDRLRSWFAERQADARMIAINRLNQEHFTELFDDSVPQTRKDEFAAFLRGNLMGLQNSRAGYLEISMTDTLGTVVIGTNRERQGKPALPAGGTKLRVSSIDGSFFCDIFLHPDTGRPAMVFGHVLRAYDLKTHQETRQVIGEVIAVIEMETTVYEFLGAIPELGTSAEALLVRPEGDRVLFLSRLLFLGNAPLKLLAGADSPIALAAQRAEMGATDAFHSTDYSRQSVIAAYRQIEPVGWGLVVKQAESEAFAPVYKLAWRIALLTGLVLLGTALLALILARNLTRPIGVLAQAAQSIAGGNFSVSLQTTRKDELGALSASFQRMVEALAERRQETEHLTDMLHRRADELEAAYRDMRQSDQLKDAFIRNITHELRTPIAALSGFTELLMDDVADFSSEQREMLQAVASQSQQIARLVNDVVALHNVAAGRRERRTLHLVEIVRASVEARRQRKSYGQNGSAPLHEFVLHCADEEIEVLAHPSQIARVIDNLIDNAVKFSPAGGTVHIQVRQVQKWDDGQMTANWQVVSITDTGIGIAEENLPHIWERFYQVDNATTRRFGGTGLGMALVKEIVEVHGGSAWIDSVLGERTTVSFHLPVVVPPKPIDSRTTADPLFMRSPIDLKIGR